MVKTLFEQHKVEEIIGNITKSPPDEDLVQDIYLTLLEKDQDLLKELADKKQLIFYLTKIITNNIRSKTSPYYYKYKRYENNKVSINEIPRNTYNSLRIETDL
jgi:hypothetical protein